MTTRARSIGAGVLGPLVGPECRRASRRAWLFVARVVAGLAAGLVAMTVLWWWWINWNGAADPDFSPFRAFRGAMAALVGLGAAVGLLLGPAVVAGSLSGEQERGSMGLLLTTRVNAFEIVLGRLAGKLSQVAMIMLAIVPPMLLIAFLAALRPASLLVLLAYGPALAVGAAGSTAGIAVMSRRGRDALIGSYAIGIGLVLLPAIADLLAPGRGAGPLRRLNPFEAIGPLVWREDPGPALASMACWLGIGLIGAAVAVNRLRPNSLRWLDGDAGGHRRARRALGGGRRRVGPIGTRPMLWKEIYIERRNSLGGLVRWVGYLAIAYLLLGTSILAGLYLDALIRLVDIDLAVVRYVRFQEFIVDSAGLFGVFIQWAVGLRAAVAIVSERERGTWDALLTSPLEGSEIVVGKLLGSLHALRWPILATLYAMGVGLAIGAMPPSDFAGTLAFTVVVTMFMAAAGVRISLGTATATTAMTLTIGVWLAALIALSILAGLLVGIGALGFLVGWLALQRAGLTGRPTPWFPIDGGLAFLVIQLALYAIATALVVLETRAKFDRLSGRIVPADAWIEGAPGPEAPEDAAPCPAPLPSDAIPSIADR